VRIAITGGTGFVGIHLTRLLLDEGHDVVHIARGQRRRRRSCVTFARADVITGEGLDAALEGAEAVIHLVGIIKEKGKQTFDAVNRQGTEKVAAAAKRVGVRHFVQLSAIGADPDPHFVYLASKWAGEQAVEMSGVPFTILRSSLMYGPGDEFFTKLRRLLRLTPFVLPIAGNGRAQFQPIAVEDTAQCILIALERGPNARIVEIGGPEQYSYQELLEILRDRFTSLPRVPLHVPTMALAVASHVPNPFITPVQVKMLSKHNITRRTAVRDLFGFVPKRFPENLDYLADY
jgi:NADH dehydrogenase